jgi:glycosyltransferase involved in cell wall biosynthesis
MKSFLRLVQIFRKYKPYLIHHFHPRPIILGNLAARSVGMAKVVNTVSGVGYAFTRNGATRYVAEVGYRLALSRSQAEIFVNHEDKNLFLQKKWSNEEKARLIVSHGVDTSRFSPSKERHTNLRVLMVSRLLWQKGVREFVEAAEIIKERHPAARFQLAGEWDLEHPNAVDKAWVEDSVAKGTIEFLGYIDNMEEYLQQIDIFVLPSFYREGLPRVLLEAAACGVPVVTTDMPGCRKAVVDGETGFIVPPQDAVALSEALSELLSDPSMRRQMGRQGRELVEEKFDKRVITEKYLDVYREMGLDL